MDITRKLKDLLSRTGLTEDEIRFYLAALKNPEKSVHFLSKQIKIPKDRAYNIFESLEDKKLISRSSGKIKANPIKRYSEKIRGQSRRLHRVADSLLEFNPFLPFYGITNDEEVFNTFQHEQSGEQFLDLSYLKWEQIHAYGDFEALINAITEDVDQHFVRNRMRRGKQCLNIVANPQNYAFNKMIKRDAKENRITKVIFDDAFKDSYVTVIPELNLTTIWQRQENGRFTGAVFNNPSIAKMHEGIYNYLFKVSDYHRFRKISEMKSQGISL